MPETLDDSLEPVLAKAISGMAQGLAIWHGSLRFRTRNRAFPVAEAAELGIDHPVDYVELALSDSGVGIPDDALEHVFEPFFTTKDIGKGSGVGLSRVYGFVQQSKGTISIASRREAGTTVCIRLPRSEKDSMIERTPASTAEQGENEMILVVEDEPDVRATTVALLRILGYRSIEAESGAQAIEVLSGRQDVDILISDIGLPGGMDGRELAEAARKLRPTLPILLISGHAAAHYEDGATLPARMQLLEKPFRKNQLGDAIRSLIDSKD